jgi:hypothetical protein
MNELTKLLKEQNELMDKWRAGDHSDELIDRFCEVDLDITLQAWVTHTEEASAVISEILAESEGIYFGRRPSRSAKSLAIGLASFSAECCARYAIPSSITLRCKISNNPSCSPV